MSCSSEVSISSKDESKPTTPSPIAKSNNRRVGLTAKGDRRQFVKHSYNDRSNDLVENLTESDENTLRLYREDSVGGTFPIKLQIILKVIEKLGQQHIISWLPHGRSFMIHRPREFEQEIMGKFFKQTKLTSFQRQLNLYDFQRITHGRDAGSYYHELFLRGRPLLAKRMVRRKVKGTKIRASSSPDDEPNFYNMEFMSPLTDVPSAGTSAAVVRVGMRDPKENLTSTGTRGTLALPRLVQGNGLSEETALGRSATTACPLPGSSLLTSAYDQAAALQKFTTGSARGGAFLPNASLLNSLQTSAALQQHQSSLYSDLMQTYGSTLLPHSQAMNAYPGALDNLTYCNALAASTALQRNLFGSSSLTTPLDRLTAEAKYNSDLALLNQDAALLESMSGIRGAMPPPGVAMGAGAPGAGRTDPRSLSRLSELALAGETLSSTTSAHLIQQWQAEQQNNVLVQQLQSRQQKS